LPLSLIFLARQEAVQHQQTQINLISNKEPNNQSSTAGDFREAATLL
jgi:hypothetical protein